MINVTLQGRNEPSNISISADFIAKAKGISVDEAVTIMTKNSKTLFDRIA